MKKITALVLTVAMAMSVLLTGCQNGGTNSVATDNNAPTLTEEEVKTVMKGLEADFIKADHFYRGQMSVDSKAEPYVSVKGDGTQAEFYPVTEEGYKTYADLRALFERVYTPKYFTNSLSRVSDGKTMFTDNDKGQLCINRDFGGNSSDWDFDTISNIESKKGKATFTVNGTSPIGTEVTATFTLEYVNGKWLIADFID